VSRYEIPGFAGEFPTGEMLDAGSLSNSQGSAGGQPHGAGDGGVVGSHPEYSGWTSSQLPPDGGTATVGALATQAAGSTMTDGISGITQANTAGTGRVIAPRGPGAGG
jgi:hypothetical protein